MENIIEMKNVSYDYVSGQTVSRGVKNVSLEIEKGSFVAILGRNGSGKSTLAKLTNGFLTPDKGEIFVNGISTKEEERIFDIRSSVGMVFQNPDNQMVASVIEDDLAFGPENLGVEREEIKRRVAWALEAVNMTEYRERTPNKLSGGQKQRISIAAVLAMLPKVLILDESTAMLDPKGRKEVLDTVRRLNKEEGMTVLLITHYMDEAVDADKCGVMADGELIAFGTPKEVFSNSEAVERGGLELPIATQVWKKLTLNGWEIPMALTDESLEEGICLSK